MDRKSGLASKLTQSVGTGQSSVTVPHFMKLKSTLNNIGSNLFNFAPGGVKSFQNCLNQTEEALVKPGFMRLDSTGDTIPDSECTSALLTGSNIFSQSSTNIGCDMNYRKQRMFSGSQPRPCSWQGQGSRPRESWLGSSMGNGQSRFPWAGPPCVPCQDPRRKPFFMPGPGDVGVQSFYSGHTGTYSQGYAIPPMSQYPLTYPRQAESPFSMFGGFGCRQANQHHATPNSRPKQTNIKKRCPAKQGELKFAKPSQVGEAGGFAANSRKTEENVIENLSHKLGEIDIASEKLVHLNKDVGVQPKLSDTIAPDKDLQRQTAVRVTVIENPITAMGQDVKRDSLPKCPTNHRFNCVKCVVMSDQPTEKSNNLTMFVNDLDSSKLSETNLFDKSSASQLGLEFVIQEVPSSSEIDSLNSNKHFNVTCTRNSVTQPSKACTNTPQRKKKSRPSKKKKVPTATLR